MGSHFDRALVLLNQSRYDLAERELRQELGGDPDNATAHAFLALCLSERKEYREATREAQEAVALAPDDSFAHYALARVFHDRDRYDEAEHAVQEATRLDPDDASNFGLLAMIHFGQRRWADALRAAEAGLRLDPEHVGCTNLRAMALVKLGRRDEAGATIGAALAKDPENAVTHANQGWTLLHAGHAKKALEHFREALRLDPELDWARQGLVEALKARNFVYRWMLRYFLWMGSLSRMAQWGIIIGGFIAFRLLRAAEQANHALAPWIWPLLAVYIVFGVMTWLAEPLSNLLLRLSRYGRLALSPDQVRASNWVGGCLLLALLSLGTFLATWALPALATWKFPALAMAIYFGLLVIPTAGTFHCDPGWPRQAMGTYTATLAGLGAVGMGLLGGSTLLDRGLAALAAALAGLGFCGLFLLGALFSELAANVLLMFRPKK